MVKKAYKWYTEAMSIGGIDGIGRGRGGYIAPPGGGGPPPPGGPNGPNGPNDDGDDDKKKRVDRTEKKDDGIRTASQIIQDLHQAVFRPTYTELTPRERERLPTIDTLNALSREPGITDGDKKMLAELRERVVLVEARKVFQETQSIEDTHEDIREEVRAMYAAILMLHQQNPLIPDDSTMTDGGSVQAVGDADTGTASDQQYPRQQQDPRQPKKGDGHDETEEGREEDA